jgi:hypothetical protein
MYLGMRWMTATDIGRAAAAVTGAAAHLRENKGWRAVGAMGLTGQSGRVGVLSIHDTLGQLLDRRTAVATDADLVAMMSESADAFVPGAATDYILRVVHGEATGGTEGGSLLGFQIGTAKPGQLGALAGKVVQIAEHMANAHGSQATVATSVGGDQQGVIYISRFESGDDMEAATDAAMGDDLMQKLLADASEHAQGMGGRIVRMLQ